MMLQPGDIFLTRGNSFISRAIRFFSRSGGESRTKVNHTGLVLEEGGIDSAVLVEALTKVKTRRSSVYTRSKKTSVWFFRPIELPLEQQDEIVLEAKKYIGRKYGYFKIVAHFLDWLIGGRYFFRRFAAMDRYPICSWVVAYSYQKAGLSFGVEPGQAQPDDIWDYVKQHPSKYKLIYKRVPRGAS